MHRPMAKHGVRGAAALGLIALAAGCVDGNPVEPGHVSDAVVLLAPVLATGGDAFASDAPITRARLTARDAGSGTVYGSVLLELDPAADLWTLPLTLELPSGSQVRVVVTIELLAVVNGGLVVQWSGVTAPLAVTPGAQANEVHQVPIYRGPPENLSVTGVRLTGLPQSVLEGDGFTAGAIVSGGGGGTTVYFSSLDPTVATVSAAGVVTTLKRGTARIVALAGPKADTGSVVVRAWTPDRGASASIDPGIEDAGGRVVGGLIADAAAGSTLRGLLGSIRTALGNGLGLTAYQALQQARQTVSGYGGGGGAASADGPELSVIGLVLDHIERILQAAR